MKKLLFYIILSAVVHGTAQATSQDTPVFCITFSDQLTGKSYAFRLDQQQDYSTVGQLAEIQLSSQNTIAALKTVSSVVPVTEATLVGCGHPQIYSAEVGNLSVSYVPMLGRLTGRDSSSSIDGKFELLVDLLDLNSPDPSGFCAK